MMEDQIEAAKSVLQQNDEGTHTVPSRDLYSHQWFWDSCFIAIGLSNYDIDRAQQELVSLLRGQWKNGMLPHMIFSQNEEHQRDKDFWRSWINPYSPDDVSTSGITQPPLLAEAVVRIGSKLPKSERHGWYKRMLPALIDYHKWLYTDRDPHNEGLVLLIHPWEVGLDNTPPWMAELHDHLLPWWVRFISKARLTKVIDLFRRDIKKVSQEERPPTEEMLGLHYVQRRLRRKAYDIEKILPHAMFAIEDLNFNCILIRANQHLKSIARSLGHKLPEELLESMKKTEAKLEELWGPMTEQYYSRNFVTHNLMKELSIAALMPLYAGTIDETKAKKLVKSLESKHSFGPTYPVPSVPLNSPWFYEKCYWQGPTWINTNWLIIDGLERMGFDTHAQALKEATIELVDQSGMYEYFSPITGEPAGSGDFSWTAALYLDLALNSK